ncbi:beta-ketoacyl synthase N-terminal-like domain-containing protein [Chondromyces apiculatus]|uniref:Beta-ketoacyl synthase-like N-terminal domain-containing protein n=1 Tax=Chondromyces apiculatus DSM 436 TaxID=1192034 RepID=A0A017TAV0_9BACT|nr:beta-ketoacyl synthase N-terminal-like domain-containing protein [Chondromyces apiculatus]EYF06413.1 Hypothetical protein CAP_1943 [Chondromyces apiculatus DSM 436]
MAERVLVPAYVTGASARCSLGLSALQVAMCVRARKGEPRTTRFTDKRQRFIGVARTPGMREDLHGFERMVALAAPALRSVVPDGAALHPVPLVLAVPEAGRPDDDPRFGGAMLGVLAEQAGFRLDGARSRTLRAGHAGVALALALALDELTRGATLVIVGGVDSYYHPEVLAWLDAECRLHALDAENGFLPGEGAGFLALARQDPARGRSDATAQGRATAQAVVRGVEVGREETVLHDAPNTAQTMTRLIAALAASTPERKIPWVLTDLNGERHRGREWAMVAARGALAEGAVHDRFAGELGDLGAATGGVLGAVTCALFSAGAAPAGSACIALSSDGPERGAFLLGT